MQGGSQNQSRYPQSLLWNSNRRNWNVFWGGNRTVALPGLLVSVAPAKKVAPWAEFSFPDRLSGLVHRLGDLPSILHHGASETCTHIFKVNLVRLVALT